MKRFITKYYKEIGLVLLISVVVFLLVKIFTPAPDKSELLKYKLQQLDSTINNLKQKQKDLDDSISFYKKDIERIDENINNIRSQKTSQKTTTPDTSKICFPTEVGKQIMLDLNELDRLKENEKLTKKEISELGTKIVKKDSVISKLEQKDVNNQLIVKGVEEKYKLVEEDNKNLRKELKWIGVKNNIIEIVSGALMASIVYIELFKK